MKYTKTVTTSLVLLLGVLLFGGCSDSASTGNTGAGAQLPGVGSVYRFVQLTPGSFGQVDSVFLRDSVLESGVALGSRTNVLHVLRTFDDGSQLPEDVFYNYEVNGDFSEQLGSLAFPDAFAWMLFPVRSHQRWSGLLLDTVITDPIETIHQKLYDTATYIGGGTAVVGGTVLPTDRVEQRFGILATIQLNGQQPSDETFTGTMRLDYAPTIRYWTSLEEYATGPNAVPDTTRIKLISYTLR